MEQWSEDINALMREADTAPAFYLYRLPGEVSFHFGVSSVVMPFKETAACKGFIVSSFLPEEDSLLILPGSEWVVKQENVNTLNQEITAEFDLECGKQDYLSSVEVIVNNLRRKGGKTVFSRVIPGEMNGHPIIAFMRLCSEYPDAMVFCWRLSKTGDTWVGATPELLLRGDSSQLQTMALAGTRKADSECDWDAKNIHEQQMVTDFIAECFERHGASPIKESPITLKAGPVEHICTRISVLSEELESVPRLLRALSPTPAVCGFPRAEAMNEISEHENFNREYYGGYCGPWNNKRDFAMFVILRCMKYISKHYNSINDNVLLFAGGGLTADSMPEEEWNETCMKASTIINIIT